MPTRPLRNRLNDLTPKQWIKFQKSWFIHNPPPRKKGVLRHPAKFPETLAQEFIEFFTHRGETVLDPMVGTGSTLVAALRCGRNSYGIELNPAYAEIARQVVEEERLLLGEKAAGLAAEVITGDAACIADYATVPVSLRSITCSPPRPTGICCTPAALKPRKSAASSPGLDVVYSDDPNDLGNIADYEEFVERLACIYEALQPFLRPQAYLTIIVKNVKKGGKIYPLAWDLARRLGQTYTLRTSASGCRTISAWRPTGWATPG